MEFGIVQKTIFNTDFGAYSVVTEREHYDSQITLTDFEADLVLQYFGNKKIHVGNVQSNIKLSSKKFLLYPSGKPINLNLVYPKPAKTELRLYISSRAGFKPNSNDIWFLFCKGNDIWIGSMPEHIWRIESSIYKADENDEIYQISIYNDFNENTIRTQQRDVFARDKKIARRRLKLAEYKCQYDPAHYTFISRYNRKPYLEAHHLIPLGLQREFPQSLDNINNIFSLCPLCHRAVHHAEEEQTRRILSKLVSTHPVIHEFGLDLSDLYRFYAVEKIE